MAAMRLLALPALLLGSTLLSAATPPADAPIALTASPMSLQSDWLDGLDRAQRPWLAYYNEDRLLRLRDPDGAERLLVPDKEGQAPSGLALAPLGDGVAVLYRDKVPDKGLYLFDSTHPDRPLLEVGGDTEPLARFQAASAAGGGLHLLWYGEKRDPETGEQYHLYYRQLGADGQTLSPIVRLLPGIYPVWSMDAAGGMMVYSWVTEQSDGPPKHRIAARYRPAGTEAGAPDAGFGAPVTVAEVPDITPIFDAFRSGSRWFAVWLAQVTPDLAGLQLQGAYSDDQGQTWQRFEFGDLRGFDIGSLRVAADDAGHLLLALTARLRSEDDTARQDVWLVRSDDRGTTWSPAQRHRAPTGQTTADAAQAARLASVHARNPSVIFGTTPGRTLLVWEDWRKLRGRLYASLSNDYGQTWTLSNVPLPFAPGTNLGLRFEPSALRIADGRFQVIAEQPLDDSFLQKRLVRLAFTPEDLAGFLTQAATGTPDDAAREALLRTRAEDYWKAMQARDYTTTYGYQDPFFRARMTLDTYLKSMGRIAYHEVQVQEVRLDGPKAEVITKIRASVPAFTAPGTGKTVSQPEREVQVKNTWLWLDGTWYQEFRNQAQGVVFTRY